MSAYRWGAATDVGRVRSNNQDMPLAVDRLFAVADGMGGHRGGEVAAQLAVTSLEEHFTEASAEALVEAVAQANEIVYDRAAGDPDLRGMGTTLTVLAPVDEGGEEVLAVVNVGDSRAYLLRDGELEQLTEDHSLVEEMVRDGRLSRDEADAHPQRHIVTRALGIDPNLEIDSFTIIPYAGDRYMLCSDGLYGEVDEASIAAALRRLADPGDAARELVRLANTSGGRDNITVVVVDVVDDGGRSEKASAAVRGLTTEATRSHPDVAGFTRPLEPEPDDGPPRSGYVPAGAAGRPAARPARTPQPDRRDRPHRLTWRVLLFSLLFLLILGAAAGAVGWQARKTFFVGFDGEEVAVFRGKPGGVLWFNPTFEEGTGIDRDEVPSARVADIEAGKEFASLSAARRYVENLQDQIDSAGKPARPATITTSTTTTTLAPVTTAATPPPPSPPP